METFRLGHGTLPQHWGKQHVFGSALHSDWHSYSTTPALENELASAFAAIDHSAAYAQAMNGRHGRQLLLAEMDAIGKDDPLYDPFAEFEIGRADVMEEAVYREINVNGGTDDNDNEEEEDDDDDDSDEDHDEEKSFRNDGSVPYKKSQLAKFQAGAPAGGLFCILDLAGTQHKATVDDVIVSNLLTPIRSYPVGSVHTFTDNVLLVGSTHKTLVGMPVVAGAQVIVMVEEITQDAKVVVFKKRRKKHSQRRNGFRRDVTMLRVLDIRMPEGYNDDDYVPRVEPSK